MNNPILYTDPSGQRPVLDLMLGANPTLLSVLAPARVLGALRCGAVDITPSSQPTPPGPVPVELPTLTVSLTAIFAATPTPPDTRPPIYIVQYRPWRPEQPVVLCGPAPYVGTDPCVGTPGGGRPVRPSEILYGISNETGFASRALRTPGATQTLGVALVYLVTEQAIPILPGEGILIVQGTQVVLGGVSIVTKAAAERLERAGY